MQQFKCSACGGVTSFHGRADAIAHGYTLTEVIGPKSVNYYVICGCTNALSWLAKTFTDRSKKKERE